ncbi:putative DNA-binding transcriptional regulator YafY [Nakamurella sp. UYEF19]|uniref:helix-turn-helix transcriptional regulator n=1 Tax=Nakamurella sp. UYEF19 TaxID=1756392 RepID=UPI0033947771
MATAKAERLLNLVIALLNTPRFRTAAWIRDKVAGYADAPTEEAFFRTFERDKTELRDLGIPLQTPDDGSDGYRIPPGEFALPELSFTPAETAALGLAARLWETTALAGPGSNAMRKIRDSTPADPDAQQHAQAAALLQPRVRTADPSFAPLYAAVRAGRAVVFDYRKTPAEQGQTRNVEPWGLVSFGGRWYLVGQDTDKNALRTFRLSRIVGAVTAVGRAGAASVPEGLDLLAMVADSVEVPADRSATLLIRPGSATGLRRTADRVGRPAPEAADPTAAELDPVGGHDGWDVVRMPFAHLWDTARTIAEQGPEVMVIDPPDLREAVIRLLVGAVGTDGPALNNSNTDTDDDLRFVDDAPVLLEDSK